METGTVDGKLGARQGANYFLYFAAVVANITSFACGTAFAWSSPVIPKLNSPLGIENPLASPITPDEESWIASLVSLGATGGPFVGGWGADKIGRKKTLALSTVPIIVSFLMTAFATHVVLFYVARVLVGVSCGVVLTVIPMYIGEIAQVHNRGTLGCLMVGFLAIGYIFTYCIGPYVSIMWLGLASAISPAICLVVFSVFIPESPYFLISKSQHEEAERALLKLRYNNEEIVGKELADITKTVRESYATKGGMGDIFRNKGSCKGIQVTLGLVTMQQASAITVILFYLQSIFESSGTTIPPELATIIVGLVQLVGSISATLVVDKLGRKILLYVSLVGCSASLLSLGSYFYLKEGGWQHVGALYWLPITSLIVYIATYNLGLGPLPYAILGEIFSPHVKSTAAALTVGICLLLSFGTSKVFPYLVEVLGNGFTFWVFGVCTGLGVVFTYLLVPETKGKTLNEIQYKLSK